MKIFKKFVLAAVMILMVMAFDTPEVGAEAAGIRVQAFKSQGNFKAVGQVGNLNNSTRYAVDKLISYNRYGDQIGYSYKEGSLSAGGSMTTSLSYSGSYSYRCKGILYNGAVPSSGVAYLGEDSFQ